MYLCRQTYFWISSVHTMLCTCNTYKHWSMRHTSWIELQQLISVGSRSLWVCAFLDGANHQTMSVGQHRIKCMHSTNHNISVLLPLCYDTFSVHHSANIVDWMYSQNCVSTHLANYLHRNSIFLTRHLPNISHGTEEIQTWGGCWGLYSSRIPPSIKRHEGGVPKSLADRLSWWPGCSAIQNYYSSWMYLQISLFSSRQFWWTCALCTLICEGCETQRKWRSVLGVSVDNGNRWQLHSEQYLQKDHQSLDWEWCWEHKRVCLKDSLWLAPQLLPCHWWSQQPLSLVAQHWRVMDHGSVMCSLSFWPSSFLCIHHAKGKANFSTLVNFLRHLGWQMVLNPHLMELGDNGIQNVPLDGGHDLITTPRHAFEHQNHSWTCIAMQRYQQYFSLNGCG